MSRSRRYGAWADDDLCGSERWREDATPGNLCGTARRYRTPPLLAATLVTLVYATVDIAAPLALSTLTPRAGWNDGPNVRNLLGIPILAAGVGTILWSAASHAAEWRERDWRVLKLDPDHLLTPEYLVTDGPYRHSRNPLYLGDIVMWAGWAVLLGSPAVALGLAVLALGLQVECASRSVVSPGSSVTSGRRTHRRFHASSADVATTKPHSCRDGRHLVVVRGSA